MATENTHIQLVAGAGQTAAGEALIGAITLPAGGPWIVHHFFGLIARATATAGELNGGTMRIESASGDTVPNPAPSNFPLYESGSFLGASVALPITPLALYPVHYEAAGKATLNMRYRQETAVTVAPQLVMGIMFGKERPVETPFRFCDFMRVQTNAAVDTAVGTITISENATRITGVCAIAIQDGVLTTAEELIGFARLASDDVDLTPMQVPLNHCYGAGLGGIIGSDSIPPMKFLPMDIPVKGGARINGFIDLNTALTNAAEVAIYLTYE